MVALLFITMAIPLILFFTFVGIAVFRDCKSSDDVYSLKYLHDRILLGEVKVDSLGDKDLLRLSRSRGGLRSPHYFPEFDVWKLAMTELEARRNSRIG